MENNSVPLTARCYLNTWPHNKGITKASDKVNIHPLLKIKIYILISLVLIEVNLVKVSSCPRALPTYLLSFPSGTECRSHAF